MGIKTIDYTIPASVTLSRGQIEMIYTGLRDLASLYRKYPDAGTWDKPEDAEAFAQMNEALADELEQQYLKQL